MTLPINSSLFIQNVSDCIWDANISEHTYNAKFYKHIKDAKLSNAQKFLNALNINKGKKNNLNSFIM